MFWERLVALCAEKDIYPYSLCVKLGLSNATATKWKNGAIPHGTTIKKISDYFNVSSDYLLGKTDVRNAEIEKMTTYSYNSEQGTAEQGFNAEQLNDINKLMKAAKELSPEKLAALIQVAENMK